MKRCYYVVLALLLLVITPVAAADLYCDMNTYDQPTNLFSESQSYMSTRGIDSGAFTITIPGGSTVNRYHRLIEKMAHSSDVIEMYTRVKFSGYTLEDDTQIRFGLTQTTNLYDQSPQDTGISFLSSYNGLWLYNGTGIVKEYNIGRWNGDGEYHDVWIRIFRQTGNVYVKFDDGEWDFLYAIAPTTGQYRAWTGAYHSHGNGGSVSWDSIHVDESPLKSGATITTRPVEVVFRYAHNNERISLLNAGYLKSMDTDTIYTQNLSHSTMGLYADIALDGDPVSVWDSELEDYVTVPSVLLEVSGGTLYTHLPGGQPYYLRVMPEPWTPYRIADYPLISNTHGGDFPTTMEVYVTAKDGDGNPLTGFSGTLVNVNTGSQYAFTATGDRG